MEQITHFSDQPETYSKELTGCTTLEKLNKTLESWRPIANDAFLAAPKTQKEFSAFRTGLAIERKGNFAGEDFLTRYGAVVMPEIMFKVAIVAYEYHVPWGLAFIRLQETGQIVIDDSGIAREATK